jgi:hypothetical protein
MWSADEEVWFYEESLARDQREYLEGVVVPEPFRVALTCADCPEQWDIFMGQEDRQVGYLRVRHSRWRLEHPDVGGKILIDEPWHPERGPYEANFEEERPAVFQRVFRALAAELGLTL